ncbi:ThiF family adenylyltransferase [Rhodopirellula sp. MGV]|uniref:ThiF family adenylyltransferase n=1 Tax=Rhodopirellula sp. MGV TaxID=2023130 RepID=UPI001E49FE86|nr:ThiF family adenylyltransferase [Rhodopirellula sp. MGV]
MSNDTHDRYCRQKQFAPIGDEGQQRLQDADVAVLGCGALGTVAAELLCRAGIGRIRIIDRDIVEWSNLQRQSLFDGHDAETGASKAEAAASRLREINNLIDVDAQAADVRADNIHGLLNDTHLVIDATDNFQVRFLLNDWALSTGTAWVHGGCVGAAGQVRLFDGAARPCFRCLVTSPPPPDAVDTCDTAGVLGSATHAIASLQVTEAIKWLSGNRDAVSQDVLAIDFWHNRTRRIRLTEDLSPDCVACVGRKFEFLDGDQQRQTELALCGRDAVQITPAETRQVDLATMEERWKQIGTTQRSRFFVRVQIDSETQLTLFRDGRVIVNGTSELPRARSLVDRYVGG